MQLDKKIKNFLEEARLSSVGEWLKGVGERVDEVNRYLKLRNPVTVVCR